MFYFPGGCSFLQLENKNSVYGCVGWRFFLCVFVWCVSTCQNRINNEWSLTTVIKKHININRTTFDIITLPITYNRPSSYFVSCLMSKVVFMVWLDSICVNICILLLIFLPYLTDNVLVVWKSDGFSAQTGGCSANKMDRENTRRSTRLETNIFGWSIACNMLERRSRII